MAADTEEHADTILRVCSYHRMDYDLTLVRSRPHQLEVVQASIETAFENPPTSGLGVLDRLPGELMAIVLHSFDLLSIFRFRQVNRAARLLITSLPEYQLIARNGLQGLGSLWRTKLAHCFTIDELYATLTTPNCEQCGAFGCFLFLPKATRCCFDCSYNAPKLLVVGTSEFAEIARTTGLLESPLHTVSGNYSLNDRQGPRPKYLLTANQTTPVLRAINRLDPKLSVRFWDTPRDQPHLRPMACTAFPWYDLENDKIEIGVCCKGCRARLERNEPFKFDWRRVYSTTDFFCHFKHCVAAQHLWSKSQGGKVAIEESEFMRRAGEVSWFESDGLLR